MVGITTFPPFAQATAFALPSLTPMQFRGQWDPTLTYVKNDGVYWNGSSYIAIANNLAQQPDLSPVFWSIMASASIAGVGAIVDSQISPTANIQGSKLLAGSVTTTQIAPATIVDANIDPAAAIVGTKLAAGTITSTQIANNTVTNADLSQMATVTLKSNITGGTANAADNTLTAILDAIISNSSGDIPRRGVSVWGTGAQTGTAGTPIVVQTAPTINQLNWVGDTTGAANPAAGSVGEILSASASAVGVSTGVAKTITQVSLTAGHWQCTGGIVTHPAASTTTSFVDGSLSLTTNVTGNPPGRFASAAAIPANTSSVFNMGPLNLNVASPTTLFLVAMINFASSTMTVDGTIAAQRIW